MIERACRNCHMISTETTCPNCNSKDVSDDFSGLVIIMDPKDSIVAEAMKVEKKGRYALRVR